MGLEEVTNVAADILDALEDLPNTRTAVGVTNRDKQIITWRLPNSSLVQMYINPQNLSINESKQISQVRTKGGFTIQYWGDNLTRITIDGTTGSAGIKGINVLRDIYHIENRNFMDIAGAQANELFNALQTGRIGEENFGAKAVAKHAKTLRERNFILRPSLASLAVNVTMIYQGAQYKGFFTDMTITESVSRLGLFDYNMTFMVTEIRGRRENFMAWHKEPLADDPSSQLVNAFAGKVGNGFRKLAGMSPQQVTPQEFHPETAPLTYGGDSLAAELGFQTTGRGDAEPTLATQQIFGV
jgi:hypothetical protein